MKKYQLILIVLLVNCNSCDPYCNMPDYIIDAYPAVYNLKDISNQHLKLNFLIE